MSTGLVTRPVSRQTAGVWRRRWAERVQRPMLGVDQWRRSNQDERSECVRWGPADVRREAPRAGPGEAAVLAVDGRAGQAGAHAIRRAERQAGLFTRRG